MYNNIAHYAETVTVGDEEPTLWEIFIGGTSGERWWLEDNKFALE